MKVNEKGVSKLSPPGRLDERRERKRKARDVSDVVPDKKQKKRIFTWRGVIANSDHWMRWMVAVILIVVGATLTYTQLGFADLVLPDGRVGYVVVLLEVVALGALLLGTLAGMTLGVIIGGVLYIHSQVLPLDHYELTFVTPLTSIVMFGVCGALLGILFAFVLRNNPSQIKRVIYICIVCLVVSELYSLGFAFNVFLSILVDIASKEGADVSTLVVQQKAASTAMQLGDMGLQANSTCLVMALICSIGDYFARRALAYHGFLGLRSVFGIWLAVVVICTFMAMSAVSFAVSSGDELRDAEKLMQSEVGYLRTQLQISNERAEKLEELFKQGEVDYDKVDIALLAELSDIFEDRLLLDGYTLKDDGVIIVTIGKAIYASDDERFNSSQSLDEVFDIDTLQAIDLSKSTGKMQRIVFDDPVVLSSVAGDSENEDARAVAQIHIAYVYAEDSPQVIANSEGDEVAINESIIMILPSNMVFAKRSSLMMWMTLSSLALLIVVFIIVFQLLNRVVAKRIDETNETLARITEGELEATAGASGTREFESLSSGINTTVDALKGWIKEAEARMDAELSTARAIQESALPRIFPPFPDVMKFDIYATMNAARQVGGDFYDFFLIGDDCDDKSGKLAFVIADVSGKGVPAALFMMTAKALLHDYVASGLELGEAVEEANRQLVQGNDAGMFVTARVGVLDYGTGHVHYVNAGHNPPLFWQRDGGWRWLRQKSGPVLGLFDMPYSVHSLECHAGDMFLLYTDGVTEAFDVNEDLYGEERLLAVVEDGYRLHPRELLESVRADVAAYTRGAEQSDDITILTLEYGVPPEVTATLVVPAQVTELNRVNEFLHSELDRRLCPQRTQNQLDIAVEELFVNVCHYAYPERDNGKVYIQRTYSAEPKAITVDIIDDGIPYNPLEKPDAVTPANIEDVPIGGLGILMAKKCTDEMRYERLDGSNIVTIVKKW